MDLQLAGKVAVITGGTAGIGLKTAIEFAKEGCKVAVCGRSPEKIETAKKIFSDAGCDVFIQSLDVSDIKAVDAFAETVFQKFGSINIWVNNAGVNIIKRSLEFQEDDWNYVMNTNLKAVFFASQSAARRMIKNPKGGVIINIASFAGEIPRADSAIYGASKAGVLNLTRSFATDLAPYGIRVVSITPGIIRSDMTTSRLAANKDYLLRDISLYRPGEQEEIAKPLVMLASDICSYITGVNLQISGGKLSAQKSNAALQAQQNT